MKADSVNNFSFIKREPRSGLVEYVCEFQKKVAAYSERDIKLEVNLQIWS
jgi:hypothetical protein